MHHVICDSNALGAWISIIYILTILLFFLTSCQTYLTPEGERLAKNVAAGCVFGEIFFEDCKAGAAVTGAATIIDGQN